MDILPDLKPFVVVTKENDTGICFGLTHGRGFRLRTNASQHIIQFSWLFDSANSRHDRVAALRSMQPLVKRALRKLGKELVACGLAEYNSTPIVPRPMARYSSQLNFFSMFDGQVGHRIVFQRRLSRAKLL